MDIAAPPSAFPRPASRLGAARLDFRHHDDIAAIDEAVRGDISVLEQHGRSLWLANDETLSVERLVEIEPGHYAEHRSFSLRDFFDLPGDTEADLEGLAVDGGYLWLTGSHALKRKKPKPEEKGTDKALERLTRVVSEKNRYLLARIPLARTAVDGVYDLAVRGTEADGGPAIVRMKNGKNRLAAALVDDIHIGRFLDVPAKENGFDIEGIAVREDRVFLGLRGPVLVGYAIVLELQVKATSKGRLKLKRIGPDGARYRKHFLDLDGLGIRELHFDGDELMMLAGPTMDLDGPVRVYRWRHPLEAESQQVIPGSDVEVALELPFGHGTDHAEGIALASAPDGGRRLLVAYDSPDPSRLHDDGRSMDADLFAW